MRIAAVVPPYLREPSPDLWAEAALNTMLTHNCPAAIASSVAWVALLWDLLAMSSVPPSNWWLAKFSAVSAMIGGATSLAPRGGLYRPWNGTLANYCTHVIGDARVHARSTVEGCNGWHSGAYLMETVPSVLWILERHAADPEEAIVRAVNDTRDNDTAAAIVGAAVGALHGVDALPLRWRKQLLGRLGADDDGHVQQLLECARTAWA